jgi:hypothetical protein
MKKLKVIYRISDVGYNKIKPAYVNNENCLSNAIKVFPFEKYDWSIIADNVSEKTINMMLKYVPLECISYVSVGNGAGTFNLALDEALQYDEKGIVYFMENDYIHKPNSDLILLEGFGLGADYISLYDNPDKYIPASRGGNKFIGEDGGEETKVYLTKSSHWKLTNSATMTFASYVSTLKDDEEIFRKWTNVGGYPQDFRLFVELREKGKSLLSPIPGYSTHGESAWLSPLTDWEKI